MCQAQRYLYLKKVPSLLDKELLILSICHITVTCAQFQKNLENKKETFFSHLIKKKKQYLPIIHNTIICLQQP